jgi:hypothetical protein
MKSGTSALADALAGLHGVFLPKQEPHYFSDLARYREGPRSYSRLFAEAPPGAAMGEKSPGYAYEPGTAERIAELLPEARLIWLFREPAARAHSHYWSFVAKRKESLSFEAALEAEPDRVAAEGASWGYFGCGCYDEQVEEYLRWFARDRLLFLEHREFERDPGGVLAEVCDFLDLRPGVVGAEIVHRVNVTRVPRSALLDRALRTAQGALPGSRLISLLRSANRRGGYPPMRAATRRSLQSRYAPHVRRLEDLTGLDLSSWSAKTP